MSKNGVRSGPKLKPSNTALYQWLMKHPSVSARELADRCARWEYYVTPGMISHITRGRYGPSMRGAVILHKITGIPVEQFCYTAP